MSLLRHDIMAFIEMASCTIQQCIILLDYSMKRKKFDKANFEIGGYIYK